MPSSRANRVPHCINIDPNEDGLQETAIDLLAAALPGGSGGAGGGGGGVDTAALKSQWYDAKTQWYKAKAEQMELKIKASQIKMKEKERTMKVETEMEDFQSLATLVQDYKKMLDSILEAINASIAAREHCAPATQEQLKIAEATFGEMLASLNKLMKKKFSEKRAMDEEPENDAPIKNKRSRTSKT
jgi:hypothetical protein